MTTFEQDVAAARAYHGHLCAGMVLGIRMCRFACGQLGIEDPRSDRDLIVYVEMARCPADAVYAVTGLTVGRRRLKLVDIGKFAMTFVDTRTGAAIRLHPRQGTPHAPHGVDPFAFFEEFSDDGLFEVRRVIVDIPPVDRPGPPSSRAVCEECGEDVLDGRDVVAAGRTLCRSCTGGTHYYDPAE